MPQQSVQSKLNVGVYRFSKLLLFNAIPLIELPLRLPFHSFQSTINFFYLLHPILTKLLDNYT